MTELFDALAVPLDEDLLPLSALLQQRQIPHRIVEVAGQQVLQVASAEHVETVVSLYGAWRAGDLQIALRRRRAPAAEAGDGGDSGAPRQAPVMLSLIAVSAAVFVYTYLSGSLTLVSLLSFMPFELQNGQPVYGELNGQYWRLVTPAFLHFGWLHIAFNCLWLWELGRRVEGVTGHFNTLMICLCIALVSNISQYLFGNFGLFGGMSGVVYGLLGFAWVAPLLHPAWAIQPQPGIMLFMIGWLVACMAGLMEALGFGSIANAAHIAGLLSGAALGAVFGFRARLGNDKSGSTQL